METNEKNEVKDTGNEEQGKQTKAPQIKKNRSWQREMGKQLDKHGLQSADEEMEEHTAVMNDGYIQVNKKQIYMALIV